MKTTKLLSWYFSTFLKKFLPGLIVVSILFIGAQIIMMCYFLFIKPLVDTAVYTQNTSALIRWGIIYLSIITSGFCLNMLKATLLSRLRLRIEQKLREYFYNHSLGIPPGIIFSKQSGYLLQRVMKDVDGTLELLSEENLSALGQVVSSIFLVWALISLNPNLALIGLTTYPLFILNLFFIAPRLRPWAKKAQEQYAQLSAKIQETLQGIITIRALGLEANEKRHFTTQLSEYLKFQWRFFIRSLIMGSGTPSLIYFPVLGLLVWLGTNQVMRGNLTIGGFMSFILLFMTATGPLRGLSVLVGGLQPAIASIERLYEFYQYKPPQVRRAYLSPPADIESICFEGVSFNYQNQKSILNNIHLKIMKSKTVALIGDSGAGKTTIANLLLGFLKPKAGIIRINDIDLDTIIPEEWLKLIGLIEQDTFIFNRSIFENIKIARLDASKEEIEEAAKKAGLYEFIMSLPQGFETMVGERGYAISGGERQRIAIARTFLKSPPVIIMDEPTSALDIATEEKIMEELKNLLENRIVLIITHRHSLLKLADFVYEIKNGEIFEFKASR